MPGRKLRLVQKSAPGLYRLPLKLDSENLWRVINAEIYTEKKKVETYLVIFPKILVL